MLKSLTLTSLIAVFTLLASSSSLHSQEDNRQAVKHLQNKEFAAAIKILESSDGADNEEFPSDYLQLLAARAYLLNAQPAKAVDAADQLLTEFPNSKWLHKAKFLKAQALSDQKKHNEASAIYEKEAEALFAPEYKDKGAQLLLEIAATLSAEPKSDLSDSPKPDLRKADNLLREAYGMDSSDMLRETILTERVKLNTRIQAWGSVIALSFDYLENFDPTWRGEINSLTRVTQEPINKNAKFQGENSFLVRFHLAEALHRSGDRLSASRYLREMIVDLEKSDIENNRALLADATWLHLMTTREKGGKPRDLEQWIADAKTYLAKFPTHIHAGSTVYTIAVIYQDMAKDELAIEAYQHFLNNQYQLEIAPNPLTSRPETKEEYADRLVKNKKRQEEVSYRIGKIYLEMNEFEKAQQAWNLSSKNFPNGARWADCQRGLVDIVFKKALYDISKIEKADPEKKPDLRLAARESLLTFINDHPLDSRVPTALYLIGNIHFQHATSLDQQIKQNTTKTLKNQQTAEFKDAINSWEKLISTYPRSLHAQDAQYLTARIYENRFMDLEKALSIYKTSPHADASNRIATLTLEKLVAKNDQTFTTDEKPFITLNSRNIEKVTVRQYWLDVESYFRKGRKLEDISSLDIDLVEADKTWEITLPDYQKYQPLESKLDIPFTSENSGICIIKVESENYSTTTMVMQSDIDISLRSSDQEVLAYVFDARTKSPARDVDVFIADAGQVIISGKTDANGIYHSTDKKLTAIKDLRILALSASGAATCSETKPLLPRIAESHPELESLKAYINIPKMEYRPGENLPISGIIRFLENGTHILPNADQKSYTLAIHQEKKLLHLTKIELNEHGAFSYDYRLPDYLLDGTLELKLTPDFDDKLKAITKSTIITHDYTEQIVLELKMDKLWANKGEIIKGTVSATYRWGAPYADQQINIQLTGDHAINLITDANGDATFSYNPQFLNSGDSLDFVAADKSGEIFSNEITVLIDPLSFLIIAKADRAQVAAGTPIHIEIETLKPDKTVTSEDITLEIVQYESFGSDPILSSCRSLESESTSYTKEVVVEKTKLTTDPKTGKIRHTFEPEKGGRYFIRITGTDENGKTVYSNASVTAHDSESKDLSLIMHAPVAEEILQAGNSLEIETWSYFKSPATALLTIETSNIIEKRIVILQPGKNTIPVALDAKYYPRTRIHLTAIHDREIYTADLILEVENKLEIVATIEEIDRKNGLALKLKLQALDASKNPVAADYFINLLETNDTYAYTELYNFFNNRPLTTYENSTNCGLSITGEQVAVRTDVRDELARLNRSEIDSIQRFRHLGISPSDEFGDADDPFNSSYIAGGLLPQRHTGSSFQNNGQFYVKAENDRKLLGHLGGLNAHYSGNIFPLTPATPANFGPGYKISQAWAQLSHIPIEGKELMIQADNATASAYKLQIHGLGNAGSYGETELEIAQKEFQITSNLPLSATVGDTWTPTFTMIRENSEKDQSIEAEGVFNGNKFKMNFQFKAGEKTAIVNREKVVLKDPVTYTISEKTTNFTPRPKGIPSSKISNRKLSKGDHKLRNEKSATYDYFISEDITKLIENAANLDLSSHYGSGTPLLETHPAGQLMAATSHLQFLIDHELYPETQSSLRKSISRICADLTLSMKDDSGWSEFRNRRESSLLHAVTAYQALVMADSLKIEFEKSTLKKALLHLQAQQKSLPIEHYNSRALVQFALAFSGDADFAICNRLYREREKMDNIGKAILANTFILLDRKEFAVNLLKEIKNENLVGNINEQFLNSPVLLDALISQAETEIDPAKANDNALAVSFSSDIDRGYSVRSYVTRFKDQPVKALPNNVKLSAQNDTITVNEDFAYISEIETKYQPANEIPRLDDFYISDRNYYAEGPTYKGNALRAPGTSEAKTLSLGETVRVSLEGKISNKNYPNSVLIEEIPAGFDYQPGSLRGNHSGARNEGNHLVITYGSVPNTYRLSYTLIASREGTWHHRETLLTPTYDISKNVYNKAQTLTVLEKGKKSDILYKLNAAEHYELARLNFQDSNYEQAKQHIISYRKLQKTTEDPVLAEMLLWIETASANPDAQLLADSFEILTERNPDLVIPFDKILKVGSAYRSLGEYERSKDVFTATLESGYNADSYVGAALEDQGEFMLSIDYQDKLWLLYPDLGEITTSRFALSQQIYGKISVAKTLDENPATKKPYTEKEITALSLKYMQDFITHAPTHELASDAAFSIANALFALKRYQDVVEHTKQAAITYKDSTHATSFRYMQALGHFWLRNYDQALASASDVATGKSEDKNLAAFITAQIYHANNQPEKALKWYNGIKDEYPDAKESITYFEQKSIAFDEVKILNTGENAKIKLKYRNIKEAQFQIYRVDLMKLYLREKNLSNISEINLAGINPKHTLTVELGDGKDYEEIEKEITLPVDKDGAYLVICRGDYIHTSGLVLITPLKMDVQEYPADNSVRVNITDKKTGKFLDSVHVKAVGKNSDDIKSGETDLRGVWQGDSIPSPTTIIARDTDGRYAFFRSKIDPSLVEQSKTDAFEALPAKEKVNFNKNLNQKQLELQNSNLLKYEEKRRAKGKGVEIKKAWKK